MASDASGAEAPAVPDGSDLLRIEKADGCIQEYWVRGLRLEYIGVTADHREPVQGDPDCQAAITELEHSGT